MGGAADPERRCGCLHKEGLVPCQRCWALPNPPPPPPKGPSRGGWGVPVVPQTGSPAPRLCNRGRHCHAGAIARRCGINAAAQEPPGAVPEAKRNMKRPCPMALGALNAGSSAVITGGRPPPARSRSSSARAWEGERGPSRTVPGPKEGGFWASGWWSAWGSHYSDRPMALTSAVAEGGGGGEARDPASSGVGGGDGGIYMIGHMARGTAGAVQ